MEITLSSRGSKNATGRSNWQMGKSHSGFNLKYSLLFVNFTSVEIKPPSRM